MTSRSDCVAEPHKASLEKTLTKHPLRRQLHQVSQFSRTMQSHIYYKKETASIRMSMGLSATFSFTRH